jgi:hypothetical protein
MNASATEFHGPTDPPALLSSVASPNVFTYKGLR